MPIHCLIRHQCDHRDFKLKQEFFRQISIKEDDKIVLFYQREFEKLIFNLD